MKKEGVAFFDFDGTIIARDSFIEFIKYSKGYSGLYMCLLFNLPYILFYYLSLYSNQKLKEKFFTFLFRNTSKEELIQKGIFFSDKIVPLLCYRGAMDIIQWHKDRNHTIYILTASSNLWLGEWCRKNNLRLICTEFETENGRFTGRIKGKNCHGAEKYRRIKSLITEYSFCESYAYGDSDADLPFISLVQHQFKMPLTEENIKKKWEPHIKEIFPIASKISLY